MPRRGWWLTYEARMMWLALSQRAGSVATMGDWSDLPQSLKNYWIRKSRARRDEAARASAALHADGHWDRGAR